MNTKRKIPANGRELSRRLAELTEQIRTRAYASIPSDPREFLRSEAEGFLKQLRAHLREEEEILFPSIRQVDPSAEPWLVQLERDHEELRLLASDLTDRVREKEHVRAEEVARIFLSQLKRHRERERDILEAVCENFDDPQARRLSEVLQQRRAHAASWAIRPLLIDWSPSLDVLTVCEGKVTLRLRWRETKGLVKAIQEQFHRRMPDLSSLVIEIEDGRE